MKLFLDLGNTRLKWQLYEDDFQQISGACGHGDMLRQAQIWSQLDIESVWLAAVGVSELAEQLVGQLRDSGFVVHELQSLARQSGVINAYAEPASLGVDRWLALLAARQHISGAALLVDAGTAVTVDLLDGQGVHQGGLIMPGLRMMRGSLHSNTQLLPEVEGGEWRLGQSTPAAIAAGTLGAAVSVVESVYADQVQAHNGLRCVITGGDAALVYNALRSSVQQDCTVDVDWLFKGLLVAAESAT